MTPPRTLLDRQLILPLALLALAAASACATGDPGRRAEPAASGLTRDYALSFIEAGPRTDALSRDGAARARILEEHGAYFEGLVERGDVLLLGVYGPGRPRWSMRGLALLDADGMDGARDLLEQDPASVSGLFTHRVVPLRAPAGLAAAAPAPAGPGGPELRAYCVVTAADGRRAIRELERPGLAGRVVFLGRLGGDRDGELLAILDVPSPDVLQALAVACSADLGGFEVARWLSSPALAARRAGEGQAPSPPPMIEPSK